MQRLLSIVFLFFAFNTIVHAGGVPDIGPPPPSTDLAFTPVSAESWDWTAPDAFTQLTGAEGIRGISTPWNYENHFGINIASNMPMAKDGWRLVTKKFVCTDFEPLVACPNPNKVMNNYPHFVLYNVYSGVMRVFIYIDSINYTGADTLHVKYNISEVGHTKDESNVNIGWRANDLEVGQPVSASIPNDLTGHEVFTEFQSNNWLLVDIPFTYAHVPGVTFTSGFQIIPVIPDNLAIRMSLYAISNSDISMNGDITFMKDGKPIGDKSSSSSGRSKPSLFDLRDEFQSARKSTSGDLKRFLEDITETSNALSSKDGQFARNTGYALRDFKNTLNLVGPVIPAGAGVSAVISAFSSFGKSGSTDIAYDSASIKLNGSISSQSHLHELSIGIPGSKHYKDAEKTILDVHATNKVAGYNGHLGLFSIERSPVLDVAEHSRVMYTSYFLYYIESANPHVGGSTQSATKNSIHINPSLRDRISLKSVKYQLEVRTNADFVPAFLKNKCEGMSYEGGETAGIRPSQNMALENIVSSKSAGQLRPDSKYAYKFLGPIVGQQVGGTKTKTLIACLDGLNFSQPPLSSNSLVLIRYYMEFYNKVTGETYSVMRSYPVTFSKITQYYP